MNRIDLSELMSEREASDYLRLAEGTLRNWRSSCPERLPFLKQGRIIRYRRDIVENFFGESSSSAECPTSVRGLSHTLSHQQP